MLQQINQQNFQVIIRVRPLNLKQQQQIQLYQHAQSKKFKNSSNNKIIKLSPLAYSFYTKFYNVSNVNEVMKVQNNTIYVIDTQYKNSQKKMKSYGFSNIYNQKQTSQEIFNQSISSQINCIFQGYNYTILAYGITGSGKTHTVFGSHQKNHKGICGLALNHLLKKKKQLQKLSGTKVNLGFSFVEIYNQNVRDLLNSQGKMLNIVQDSKGNTSFTEAIQIQIHNQDQIHDLINIGLAKRSSGATMANQYSSRSHAILQMNVEIINQNSRTNSKMFIIDLAGSQKLQTLNCAKKMQEGANINKSLLALGNCINILAQSSKKGLNGSIVHIPYRDSKLTRILKDSLGGNAKTLMISCVSENPFTIEQTISTLNYAQRAQGIKKQVKKNKVFDEEEQNLCSKCMREIGLQEKNVGHSKMILPPHLRNIESIAKQQMLDTFFQQIYEDMVQNIKQKYSIQKLLNSQSKSQISFQEIQKIREVNENQRVQLKETMWKLFTQKQQDYNQKLSELNQFMENFNRHQQTSDQNKIKRKITLKKEDVQNQKINGVMQKFKLSLSNRASTQRIRSISLERKPLRPKQNNQQQKQNNEQERLTKPHESIKFLLNSCQRQTLDQNNNVRFSFASLFTSENMKTDFQNISCRFSKGNANGQGNQQTNQLQKSNQKFPKKKRSRSKFEVVKKMSASKMDLRQSGEVSQ